MNQAETSSDDCKKYGCYHPVLLSLGCLIAAVVVVVAAAKLQDIAAAAVVVMKLC